MNEKKQFLWNENLSSLLDYYRTIRAFSQRPIPNPPNPPPRFKIPNKHR